MIKSTTLVKVFWSVLFGIELVVAGMLLTFALVLIPNDAKPGVAPANDTQRLLDRIKSQGGQVEEPQLKALAAYCSGLRADREQIAAEASDTRSNLHRTFLWFAVLLCACAGLQLAILLTRNSTSRSGVT